MEPGILRVSETAKGEIEAVRAFVTLKVTSNCVAFGNAALKASTEVKAVVSQIKHASESVDINVEAIALENKAAMFGSNSTAHYTLKLTVSNLAELGAVLGVCAEAKQAKVNGIRWGYNEDQAKRQLITQAIRQAKAKATDMMAAIDYEVAGLRTCSDSYVVPTVNEIVLRQKPPVPGAKRARSAAPLDIGTQFKSKKEISATCSAEFYVRENAALQHQFE